MTLKNKLIMHLSILISFSIALAQTTETEFSGDVFGRERPNFYNGEIRGVVPKGTKAEILQVRQTERGFAIQVKVSDVSQIEDSKKDQKGIVKPGDVVWVYHRNKQPWMKFKDPDGNPTKDPLEALYSEAKKSGTATAKPSYDEVKPLVVADAMSMIQESMVKIEKAQTAVAALAEPAAGKTEICVECLAQSFNLNLSIREIEQKTRGEALVTIDECNESQGIKSSYVERITTQGYKLAACNPNQKISKALAEFMNKNLASCAQEGLKAIGVQKEIKNIHLKHAGIIGDASHSSKSLHSVLRAIDLVALELTLNDSTKANYSLSNGWKAISARRQKKTASAEETQSLEFYSKFRSCWASKLTEQNGCNNNGKAKLKGSVGWEDPDHREHLHLSIPYCPNPNGFYGS